MEDRFRAQEIEAGGSHARYLAGCSKLQLGLVDEIHQGSIAT